MKIKMPTDKQLLKTVKKKETKAFRKQLLKAAKGK